LLGLARDTHANVRNAALEALFELDGHGIDELAMEQLQGDDPQLLITVAGLLEGSPRREEAAAATLAAFERISEARRETWRDPRLALLTRIAELGEPDLAPRLLPFLRDYDPLVATEVAGILTEWTGAPHLPEPTAPLRAPLPTAAELGGLGRTSVALHMRRGGSIVIQLLPELAPLNAWRFVRLAREGYFDGLTFHRWEPNFVIQGGSPGANEYAGDGPYTRDEVGASHWRGTVGVSTRGRDTGDGQIFINLVDNVRLDHDYTVFGVVTEGMDVVDRVLEGAIIERAEVRREP
jgi:cyclophilin family peptidyl-prolyl cis-trans isomerase